MEHCRVAIDKRQCPAGFDTTGTIESFRAACTTPHDGVRFLLADDNPANPEFQVTAAGHAEWNDVIPPALGTLTISETLPSGFGTPVVFCGNGEIRNPMVVTTSAGIQVSFSDIGDPARFFATLRAQGIDVAEGRALADHHAFTPDEIARLVADAAKQSLQLVTTE